MVGRSRQIRSLICVMSIVLFSGCAGLTSYNPATGRNELVLLSTKEENALGLQSHKELMQNMKISKNPILTAQLDRIGARIAAVSDRQDYTYNFYVIEGDDFNAFTTPGGHVYVYEGLMKALKTDDRIAGVVAHEVGHCAAKHVAKKFQKALGYNLLYNVAVTAASGSSAQSVVQLGSGTVMKLAMSAYSRKDEYEADRLGVKYATLAGYDPNGLVEGFQVLQAAEKGPQVPTIFRTHPHTHDRIDALKPEVLTAPQKYRK